MICLEDCRKASAEHVQIRGIDILEKIAFQVHFEEHSEIAGHGHLPHRFIMIRNTMVERAECFRKCVASSRMNL